MGAVLSSTPNKVTGGGNVATNLGQAVVSFNANNCKNDPTGVFQLRIKDYDGLHIKATLDQSVKIELCSFFGCGPGLCVQGETELLGSYTTQGKDAVKNPGEGYFTACISDEATGGSFYSLFDNFNLEMTGGPYDGLFITDFPQTDEDLNGNFVEHEC
jgi:hypothetical protein